MFLLLLYAKALKKTRCESIETTIRTYGGSSLYGKAKGGCPVASVLSFILFYCITVAIISFVFFLFSLSVLSAVMCLVYWLVLYVCGAFRTQYVGMAMHWLISLRLRCVVSVP